MSLIGYNTRIIRVGWIGFEQEEIRNYLQGLVDERLQNHSEEWFTARDLIGKSHGPWGGTPLHTLYDHYHEARHMPESIAIVRAGIDAGKLLKDMLKSDSRVFETRVRYVRQYRLMP